MAKGAKVLVTGGAGYVGSHVCKALSAANFVPVTFDNLSTGHRWAVKWGPLEIGDVCDADLLEWVIRRHGIVAILHFAALSLVGQSSQQALKYYDVNVGGAMTIARAMVKCHLRRLVFSSTCAVYGIPAELPILEQAPCAPLNVYGRTKLAAENLFLDMARAEIIDVAALRYFNAAGADPDGEIGESHAPETHLIPLAIAASHDRERKLDLYGTDYPTLDGTCIRDYIHVTDLASAHLAALRFLDGHRGGYAFNLGTGTGVSVREVIASVERVTGRTITVVEQPRRAGDPECLYASPGRARQELGWAPAYADLDAIVASAVKWRQATQINGAPQLSLRCRQSGR